MTPSRERDGNQLLLLVGGLFLIAGLLTLATLAAMQVWLTLAAGALLLAVGLVGLRRGVPRLLAGITIGFAVVVLAAAAMQWSTG